MGQTTIDEILLKNAQTAIDEVKKMGISRNSLSDGYHSFGELYHHRAVLFSMICNQNKERAWKSLLHSDGTMYEGMFIVGIDTPFGEVTYHYDLLEWDLFQVKIFEKGKKWDGSTPDDCVERMKKWSEYVGK